MTTRNSCYTFFQITGKFDPDEVSRILDIAPEKGIQNRRLEKRWYCA